MLYVPNILFELSETLYLNILFFCTQKVDWMHSVKFKNLILPEYTLGHSLGAPRLYPRVFSRLHPGIVQNIPGYSSLGVNLGGYTGMN